MKVFLVQSSYSRDIEEPDQVIGIFTKLQGAKDSVPGVDWFSGTEWDELNSQSEVLEHMAEIFIDDHLLSEFTISPIELDALLSKPIIKAAYCEKCERLHTKEDK